MTQATRQSRENRVLTGMATQVPCIWNKGDQCGTSEPPQLAGRCVTVTSSASCSVLPWGPRDSPSLQAASWLGALCFLLRCICTLRLPGLGVWLSQPGGRAPGQLSWALLPPGQSPAPACCQPLWLLGALGSAVLESGPGSFLATPVRGQPNPGVD